MFYMCFICFICFKFSKCFICVLYVLNVLNVLYFSTNPVTGQHEELITALVSLLGENDFKFNICISLGTLGIGPYMIINGTFVLHHIECLIVYDF